MLNRAKSQFWWNLQNVGFSQIRSHIYAHRMPYTHMHMRARAHTHTTHRTLIKMQVDPTKCRHADIVRNFYIVDISQSRNVFKKVIIVMINMLKMCGLKQVSKQTSGWVYTHSTSVAVPEFKIQLAYSTPVHTFTENLSQIYTCVIYTSRNLHILYKI